MRKMWITAHSGCEGTRDNSMESVLMGIELGAECVEVDVRLDGKGRLVLNHDAREGYEDAVLLEEALKAVAESGIGVNCDLKEYGAIYPALELAERCGVKREKLIFSGSVDPAILEKDASIARRARIFLNSEELYRYVFGRDGSREEHAEFMTKQPGRVAELLEKLGAEALNAPYSYFDMEDIALLRSQGIELSLWTVNDEEAQRALVGADLLNMTTRRVRSAITARDGQEMA